MNSRQMKDVSATTLSHLLNPVGRPAQSLRAFALLICCWLISVISTIMVATPLSYHIGQMLMLLGVLIIHLNYASEGVTFQVKLVCLPLATTLALLGILPFLLFGVTIPEETWDLTDSRLHRQLSVFAWLIPGSTAFILISFILFYRVGLLRPLSSLLRGVQRIEAGDLQTPVPIVGQDEIGYLANSLNRMATSLKVSQDELEKRVTDRTAELQATLTRLQATQIQLIQKEKMASLGELTAGIAHEIQNPLNFVNNFSEVSQELCGEIEGEAKAGNIKEILSITADLKQNLEKIYHHGRRADSIVKGMLEHSRASSGEKQLTDINALAEEYLNLSYHGIRAKDKDFNANLITDFDTTIGKVEVVPQELGRVLLNLFNNAFYAVSQKKQQLNGQYQPQVIVSTKATGDKIEILVRDNGTGIPESVQQKIFQPFFTTKPTGEGTGLGLSLSYDIITKGHSGELKLETKEGEFAEFIIILQTSY
jgi:signal transduction histidine kinase